MKRLTTVLLISFLTMAMAFAQESNRIIEMKSVIITMTSEFMEQTLITKKYFDDYGQKFAQFTLLPFYDNGGRRDSLIVGKVRCGDVDIVVDYINHALRIQTKDSLTINFLNLTEDVVKKYKIKRIGEEYVCGKPCVKYSFVYKIQGNQIKTQVWVWKGVTLKKRDISFLQEREMEAIDIQVDVPIDSSFFVVPDYPMKSWSDKDKP